MNSILMLTTKTTSLNVNVIIITVTAIATHKLLISIQFLCIKNTCYTNVLPKVKYGHLRIEVKALRE